MIQPSTIKFLSDLRKHNNREWFEKNKGRYELAREDFNQFIATLIAALSKVDPRLKGLEPNDCVFRIYRDVRFSKNKDPYKGSFSASIKVGGRKSGNCGLYIHIEPKGEMGNFIAGGNWMPEPPVLKQIRQEIEYNTSEFKKIINNAAFKKWYKQLEDHKLRNVPRGFDADQPDSELLKYTSFIASHDLSDAEILSSGLIKKCVDGYKAIKPLLDFLNRVNT